MPEPRPGFERDVKAIVEAFKVGLQFDPPAISVKEFRAELRDKAAFILAEDDDLDPPRFEFPEPVQYDDAPSGDDITEGGTDGYDPAA